MSKLIFVKAKTRKRETLVEKVDATHYIVSVKEAPAEGKANKAVLKALAGHFNMPYSSLKIAAGHTSRQKVIEIF